MNTRLRALRSKLGPVLFQLPAHFEADAERLQAFLAMLPKGRRHVFEFRHESWYDAKILEVLARVDRPDRPALRATYRLALQRMDNDPNDVDDLLAFARS